MYITTRLLNIIIPSIPLSFSLYWQVGRVFTNVLVKLSQRLKKMVLDTLLNTQHYKVYIKSKVEPSTTFIGYWGFIPGSFRYNFFFVFITDDVFAWCTSSRKNIDRSIDR